MLTCAGCESFALVILSFSYIESSEPYTWRLFTGYMGAEARGWGTWEELILGGAVLRHGIQDWNVVASELRSRTIPPYNFTPQACKAKYEDLQKRYSGCNAWFEELRKRRVEELKRELEKSESTIGSLLRKIESLKAEKEESAQIDHGSSHTESPAARVKSECVESIGKDGISAGSVTRDSTLPEIENRAVASAKDIDSKLDRSESCEPHEVPSISKPAETAEGNGGALRKRRDKRKMKDDILDGDERSIREIDNVCSISGISASHFKETSTSCDQSFKPSADLMEIFNTIIQNEAAMVFRHRRDSQKRARYKEMIKQHMDIETVRSRIVSCSIKSASELFRDLLLLANNAIVFYSKRTREYKSAMALRDIITKTYHDHCKSSYHTATSSLITFSTTGNLPVKPRSARPHSSKFKLVQAKSSNRVTGISETRGGDDRKPSDAASEVPLQSLLAAKKGFKGPAKFKCGSVDGAINRRTKVPGNEDTRTKTPVKEDRLNHLSEMVTDGRKRARRR